jgi:hypothetical protein
MQPRENQVTLRPVQVGQHTKDLYVHGLGLRAFEHRVRDSAHPGMQRRDGHSLRDNARRGSLVWGGGLRNRNSAQQN